ncbi:hypothetical protein QCA50_016995 [Cerrena zonata]|uniref:Uncharacterized protein n=1 Tax=Cerrena zonata TaxID=2478898 RepID=A0AAW0FP73_9APHY
MLIAYFMDGYQLPLFPQNFEGVNFYPGIQRGVNTNGGLKPKQIATKRSEALEHWKKIKKGAWTDLWYGVPYAEAREAYADHVSRNDETRARFKGSVWQITDLPNAHQLRLVGRYYELLDAIQAKSNWTSFDMLAHVLLVPTILEIPPPGKRRVQNPPPQKRGMSRAQWLKHLEDGGDEKYEAIEGYEDEDKDLPAAESEDEAAQDDGHSKPERKRDQSSAASSQDTEEDGSQSPSADSNTSTHSLVSETDIDDDDTARDGPRTWREGHGPVVPGIKRKAKPSSSDEEGSESALAEESWGGISPTSEESENSRLRRLASSQSPMRRVKKRVNLDIPSRREATPLTENDGMEVDCDARVEQHVDIAAQADRSSSTPVILASEEQELEEDSSHAGVRLEDDEQDNLLGDQDTRMVEDEPAAEEISMVVPSNDHSPLTVNASIMEHVEEPHISRDEVAIAEPAQRTEQHHLDDHHRSMAHQLDEMKNALETLRGDIETSTTETRTLRYQLNVMTREHNNLQNAFNDLKADFDELEIKHNELAENYNTLQANHERNTVALNTHQTLIEARMQEFVQDRLIAMFDNAPPESGQHHVDTSAASLSSDAIALTSTAPITQPLSSAPQPPESNVHLTISSSSHVEPVASSAAGKSPLNQVQPLPSSSHAHPTSPSSSERTPSGIAMPPPSDYPPYSMPTPSDFVYPVSSLRGSSQDVSSPPPESHYAPATFSALSSLTPLPSAYGSVAATDLGSEALDSLQIASTIATGDPSIDVGTSISSLRIHDSRPQNNDEDISGEH